MTSLGLATGEIDLELAQASMERVRETVRVAVHRHHHLVETPLEILQPVVRTRSPNPTAPAEG